MSSILEWIFYTSKMATNSCTRSNRFGFWPSKVCLFSSSVMQPDVHRIPISPSKDISCCPWMEKGGGMAREKSDAWIVRSVCYYVPRDGCGPWMPPQSSVLSATPMQVQSVVNISLSIIDGAADRFRMHMGKTEIHFLSYKPLTRSTVYRYILYFYFSWTLRNTGIG